MNSLRSILLVLLAAACPLAASAQDKGSHPLTACASEQVDVGGRRLWVNLEGQGKTTVVFDTGNGNDSSAWAGIAPRIRAAGARIFVYDRAGSGKSEPGPQPYSIDDEAKALQAALTACGVQGPVILAAHSYGGFISLLLASRDKRVDGLVLVDAVIPAFFNQHELDAILARYRPQYDEVRKQAPDMARTLIPVVEAFPATARRVGAAGISPTLPVIDIVAEESWFDTAESTAAWHQAHEAFVANNSSREAIFAAGSTHNVMRDKPALVVDAIVKMMSLTKPK